MLSPSYIKQSEVGDPRGRIDDYPKMWKEFVKKPLFGRGFGTFDPLKFFYVDNQYLKHLVETGIFGMTTLFYFFYCVLRRFWRSANAATPPQKDLLLAIMASSFVFMLTMATFDALGFGQVPYLFFVLISLGMSQILNLRDVLKPGGVLE